MKKNILFLIERRLSQLPPAMAIIDSIVASGLYNVTIVEAEEDAETEENYRKRGVRIESFYLRKYYKNPLLKILNKLKKSFLFYKNANRVLRKYDYDILWILHERTAAHLGHLLKGKKYILSSYELNDEFPKLRKKLSPIIKNAFINVACEYNRAHIMKVWYELDKVPYILPNKPYSHPRKKNIECPFIQSKPDDKIILYQGHISGERNLETICKTISSMNGYRLVLMGDGDGKKLTAKYPNIEYVGYVKAPAHLMVTSHAYIGIVTYKDKYLNTMYCAPNKIWEYSGFAVPMIANDIPGLKYTVGAYKAGLCIDTNDSKAIQDAINLIDSNYQNFSNNAKSLYDSVDISVMVLNILTDYQAHL